MESSLYSSVFILGLSLSVLNPLSSSGNTEMIGIHKPTTAFVYSNKTSLGTLHSVIIPGIQFSSIRNSGVKTIYVECEYRQFIYLLPCVVVCYSFFHQGQACFGLPKGVLHAVEYGVCLYRNKNIGHPAL